jgi:hypothetical protein
MAAAQKIHANSGALERRMLGLKTEPVPAVCAFDRCAAAGN